MATFYGQVAGSARTRGTRVGSFASDIRASVQSWNGSVTTRLYYDKGEQLCIEVEHSEGSKFGGCAVFDGTVTEFVETLREAMRKDADGTAA